MAQNIFAREPSFMQVFEADFGVDFLSLIFAPCCMNWRKFSPSVYSNKILSISAGIFHWWLLEFPWIILHYYYFFLLFSRVCVPQLSYAFYSLSENFHFSCSSWNFLPFPWSTQFIFSSDSIKPWYFSMWVFAKSKVGTWKFPR